MSIALTEQFPSFFLVFFWDRFQRIKAQPGTSDTDGFKNEKNTQKNSMAFILNKYSSYQALEIEITNPLHVHHT